MNLISFLNDLQGLTEALGDRIVKNPSTNGIMQMLRDNPDHILKGWFDPKSKDFWLADGYTLIHSDIAYKLGLDSDYMCPIILALEQVENEPKRVDLNQVGIACVTPAGHTHYTSESPDPDQAAARNEFFALPQIRRLPQSRTDHWKHRWI